MRRKAPLFQRTPIGGLLLDYFNRFSPNSGYRAVFASAIVFFVLGTVFVSRVKSVR